MPFGLANAPATFQTMIQEILKDLIDMSVVAYIDDILIYMSTESRNTSVSFQKSYPNWNTTG
jgi:hypothetical protein